MDTANSTRVLLIDIENGIGHIQSRIKDLKVYQKVIVCYAHDGVKIPLDWLVPLSEVLQSGQLELIKMPQVAKNAADFGLYFIAGMLAERFKQPTAFTILSNDTDLDYLLQLLQRYQHQAERISLTPIKESAPIVQPPPKLVAPVKPVATVVVNMESQLGQPVATPAKTTEAQKQFIYRYCQRLSQLAKTAKPPANKQALLKSIRSFADGDQALTDKSVHYLVSSGAYKVKGKTGLEPNLDKIREFAAKAKN